MRCQGLNRAQPYARQVTYSLYSLQPCQGCWETGMELLWAGLCLLSVERLKRTVSARQQAPGHGSFFSIWGSQGKLVLLPP